MRQNAGIVSGKGSRVSLVAVLLTLLSICTPALSDNLQYSYDALGRVIEAFNSTTGQATEYSYDAAGNITSTQIVALAAVSVAGFSPSQGAVGAQVVISGTGFNTTPSANTVKFNGTVATVSAATATQITVTVPAGATTGAISVSNAAGSATGGTFTVISGNNSPTIASFSPTAGPVGTAVTVTGTNYQPLGLDNLIFGQSSADVTAATATTLNAAVPLNAGSGPLQVTTPFGTAVSGTSFLVLPSGYTASSIGASGTLTVGTAGTVNLPTASKIGVELFSGTAGQYLTLGITGNTIANATVSVYDPFGRTLVSAAVTSSTPAIQLPRLAATGTYTIVVNPGSNTGNMTLTVVAPLTGTLTLGGAALPLNLSPAGRRALISFSGTAGQYVTLAMTAVTLSGSTVSILNPDGSVLTATSVTTIGASALPALPVTGVYTVLVNPAGAISGNITLSLTSTAVPSLNTSQGYALTLSNLNPVALTFTGVGGQYFSLDLHAEGQASSSFPYVANASVTVLKPDGSVLATGTYTATEPCFLSGPSSTTCSLAGDLVMNLGPLQQAGTYTVVVQQTSSGSGTMNITLANPLQMALTSNAAPVPVSVALRGQGILATFSGSAGQYFSVDLRAEEQSNGGIDYIPGAVITVLRPDGSVLSTAPYSASDPCSASVGSITCSLLGDGLLNLWPVPETGTYTVLVQQTSGNTGTVNFVLSNPVQTTLAPNTTSAPVNATLNGQGIVATFSGTAGQYFSIDMRPSDPGNGDYMPAAGVTVLNPDGSVQATGTFSSESVCSAGCVLYGDGFVNLGPLSQTGTYTILFEQWGGNTGAISFLLANPIVASVAPNAAATPVNMALKGQGFITTFTGAVGQYFSLDLRATGSLSSADPYVPNASITVLKPDGSVLATGAYSATEVCQTFLPYTCDLYGDGLVNLGPLQQAGTYTVVVQQLAGNAGTVNVVIANPVQATVTPNAGDTPVSVSLSGQGILTTFTGATGQYWSVHLSPGGSQADYIGGANVTVLKPDGSVLATGVYSASVSCSGCALTGGVLINLGPLPSPGTYVVLLQQTSGQIGTVNFNVSSPNASSVTLTAAPNPAGVGQSVSFTATVSAASPTGSVTFKDGSSTLGTVALSSGAASYSTSALSLGNHSITAVYSGDNLNSPATSSAVTQQITQKWGATIALSSSSNPSVRGNAVTFSATVTGSSPTGTVTFNDGSTALGSVALASGSASLTTSTLASGTHSITAVYGGDTANNGKTSAVLSQVVKTPAAIAWLSGFGPPSSVIVGQTMNVQAKVTGTSPTGTATFLDGSTVLATITLFSDGRATPSLVMPVVGSRTITSQYGGDAQNSTASMTTPITVNAKVTPTVAWRSGFGPPSSVVVGHTFNVQAQLTGAGPVAGGTIPTGTVTFLDGSTVLATTTVMSDGRAAATLSMPATGARTITVQYGGDASNTSGSFGTAITVTAN